MTDNEKIKFSGTACIFGGGLTFYGEKYKCSIYECWEKNPLIANPFKNKIYPMIELKKIKNKNILMRNIFLIYGIVDLYAIFHLQINNFINSFLSVSTSSNNNSIWTDNIIVNILTSNFLQFFVFLYVIKMLYTVRQYHGAEHKVISATENNDLHSVKNYTTIHPRCGTNLFPIFLFFTLTTYCIFGYPLLLISFLIAIVTIKKIKPIRNLSVYIGKLLQRITTGEPNNFQLNNATMCMEKLIKGEEGKLSEGVYYE